MRLLGGKVACERGYWWLDRTREEGIPLTAHHRESIEMDGAEHKLLTTAPVGLLACLPDRLL